MKKIFKVVAILGVLFIGALAAGIFTLKTMFPPEKLKALITKEATDFLQREVKVGEVQIGLLGGITISDFAVSESHTFKSGTFISSEKFVLKFQILPLIRKKVVVDEIALQKPQIQIIRRADGKTFNYSDLLKTSTETPKAAAPEKTGEAPPLALTVTKAGIADGNIVFIDQGPSKDKISLNPINLSVKATGLDKPMSIAADVRLDGVWGGKKLSGALDVKSVVDIPAQRINVESLSLKTDAAALEANGTVSSFLIKPQADVTLTLKSVDFAKLSQWIELPKEVKLSGNPKATIHIKGSQDNLESDVNLNLTQVDLSYSDVFKKSAGTEFTAEIKAKLFKQMDVRLDSFKLRLAAMEAGVKGEINKAVGDAPELNLKINVPSFDVKEIAGLSGLAGPYHVSGKISLDAGVKGTLKRPQVLGNIALNALGAAIEGFNVESVGGKVNFTDDSIELPLLTGKISAQGKPPAEFKVSAGVKNFKNPDATLNADFAALDLGMFLSEGKKEKSKPAEQKPQAPAGREAQARQPEIKAQGKITVAKVTYTKFDGQKFEANWKLTGMTPTLEKLNGQMEVKIGQGKIHNIPLLQLLAPFLKIDSSGGLVYSRIGGHWNITNGTAKTDDFQINSPNADMYAKGSVYLPKSAPDLSLIVKLPKGSVGGTLGQYTQDAEGRPTLTFKLKGDWKPSLDASAVSKQATEEIKKKAGEILENEGKKILEGIFKR